MNLIQNGFGVKKIGKAQRRIILMMMENNGVWRPEWRIMHKDKIIMESLVNRGIAEPCEIRVGTEVVESYRLTAAFKEGRVP